MTDNNKQDKDTLKVTRSGGTLQLGKSLDAKARSGFQSAGRGKTVTVEVRKTRSIPTPESAAEKKAAEAVKAASAAVEDFSASAEHGLTTDERESRLRALKTAETNAKENAAKESQRRERDNVAVASRKAAAAEPAAPIAPVAPGEEIVTKRPDIVTPIKPVQKLMLSGKDEEAAANSKKANARVRREEPRRNSGKLTVTQALTVSEERMRSMASIRRQREKARRLEGGAAKEAEKIIREVTIPEVITVQELSNRMAERAVDIVKMLMKMGTIVTVNQTIDPDTAELIVNEFGHKVKRVAESDVENIITQDGADDASTLKSRPPVVTIMGHVDHGKTSLLDALRKTDVVAGEAGGITQHIGAYQVEMSTGGKITFLDTPGHEAFTAMRARGAKVTDIVVLVVAADDGIKDQTKEAISHAKAANVPIIVAINKVDKPDADPARVRAELMNYELVAEEFGGDVMVVEVSAKQGIGLEKLEETILLQAEVLELKANPDRHASGVVVEAKIDRGRGAVATLLIQRGTLRVGDIIVAGSCTGRVRALIDDKGRMIKEALPAAPVEVLGLDAAPIAGDEFAVVENEKTARDIAIYRDKRDKALQAAASVRPMEAMFAAAGPNKLKELAIIVKADVQGSVEAIVGSLTKLSNDEVTVRVLHSGVGGISESDITLGHATGAAIIAFNVRATAQARDLADKEKVLIRYYSIIYDVVDEIKQILGGMLTPTKLEKFLGYAEIRQVFSVSKAGKVAGCMVTEGVIKRGSKVRLLRDNVVIHEGALKTLKRFKDDAKEVKSGLECGIAFENYDDIREKDMVEAFEIEEVARTV